MRELRRLWQAALLLPACRCNLFNGTKGFEEDFHISAEVFKIRMINGCYFTNHAYTPPMQLATGRSACYAAEQPKQCQEGCERDAQCKFFTFRNASQECCFSGDDAVYTAEDGALAGPKICHEVPDGCTDVPGPHFPGATAQESELAWPAHRVPRKLECWPKNWKLLKFLPCNQIKVLEESDKGFPGRCSGLKEVPLVPQFQTCEKLCRESSFCTLYQEVRSLGPYGTNSCWHGYGTSGLNCYINPDQNFVPISAKRFQQGSIRVIKKTTGYVIKDLRNTFGPYWFATQDDAAHACKLNCYSNIMCQYWQYSTMTGCWLEDPIGKKAVQMPPTLETWNASDPAVQHIIGGEYLQHTCTAVRENQAPGVAPVASVADANADHDSEDVADADVPMSAATTLQPEHDADIEEDAVFSKRTFPYSGRIFLGAMVVICIAAGIWGYMSSRHDEDDKGFNFSRSTSMGSQISKEEQPADPVSAIRHWNEVPQGQHLPLVEPAVRPDVIIGPGAPRSHSGGAAAAISKVAHNAATAAQGALERVEGVIAHHSFRADQGPRQPVLRQQQSAMPMAPIPMAPMPTASMPMVGAPMQSQPYMPYMPLQQP